MIATSLVFIVSLLLPASWISTAHAQTTNVTCLPAYSWMTNSMGQNPCLVTAWLYVPCYGKSESQISVLQPGYEYAGPPNPTYSTTCVCNTVVYSLLAACAICQNGVGGIQKWPVFSTNCTKSFNESYPNTIPNGTAVPEWAFLSDVISSGSFDVNAAQSVAAQGLSDVTATSTSSTSTTSALSSSSTAPASDGTETSSQSTTPTSSSAGEHSSRNAGAIAGGAVGAVVAVLLVGALVIYIVLRHRRQTRQDQDLANSHTMEVGELLSGSVAPSYHVPTLQSEVGSFRGALYDPNDPRTFPPPQIQSLAIGYAGLPQVMS